MSVGRATLRGLRQVTSDDDDDDENEKQKKKRPFYESATCACAHDFRLIISVSVTL